MKFCTILAVIVALVTIVGTSQGAQIVLPPTQVQIAAHLFHCACARTERFHRRMLCY
jgi:hypothetical protein